MSLSAESVVAASNAWAWVSDEAVTVETDEYLLTRFPDYFDHPLEVMRFRPAGPVEEAMTAVLDRAREFGLPVVYWFARLDGPAEVPALLAARGATVDETLDVLAADLTGGAPTLPPPAWDVELRWATDAAAFDDEAALTVAVFGGSLPPEGRSAERAEREGPNVAAGEGGSVIAYAADVPVGMGGVSMAGEVARLWGGGVAETARGHGVYRAVLGARLAYGAAHGAKMALVKGRIETSGPILRQAGFAVYGQEVIYRVPLT
jgi:hypothetical protein